MKHPVVRDSCIALAGFVLAGFVVLKSTKPGDLPAPPSELEEIKSSKYLVSKENENKYTKFSYRFEEGREGFITEYYLTELRSRGWKIQRNREDAVADCFGCISGLTTSKRRTITAVKGPAALLIRISYGNRIDLTLETSPIKQAASASWL